MLSLSSPALSSVLTALFLWAASSIAALVAHRHGSHRVFSICLLAGSLLLMAGALLGFRGNVLWQAPVPLYFGLAPLLNRLDSLSAVFLVILALVGGGTALFSPGYLTHMDDRLHRGAYWACLFLFMLSMGEVVLSANVLTFLVFWEIMSLSSVALVLSDHLNHRSQRAAMIYLGATRVATAFLAGGFLWLHLLTHSWTFSDWHLSGPQYFLPVLLVMIGLLIKSGSWPFHIWLPYAHPAAPTPVSALMSGVMVKIAIYALIRFTLLSGTNLQVFSYILLFLGAISAFWGVLFALGQQDVKQLLAYSTIENIGLILMALAVAAYCKNSGSFIIASIALAAAVFHSINHAIFKSLLFFGTGAIDSEVGTRDLSGLGGLMKRMPVTGACFLTGSLAICALPPLNGFASKWLLYQSLFGVSWGSSSPLHRAMAIASIGVLSLVGGLSVACFTRLVGISLVGQPRTRAADDAREVSRGMVAAQLLLSALCVGLGLTAPKVLQLLQGLCRQAIGQPVDISGAFLIPQGILAAALLFTILMIYALVLGPHRGRVKQYITWECGFGNLSARAEATAASFSQPIERIFRNVLLYSFQASLAGKDQRHFPEQVKVDASMSSLLESQLYAPLIRLIRWSSERMAAIQTGSIHLYLLYMLITLVVLLVVGTKL